MVLIKVYRVRAVIKKKEKKRKIFPQGKEKHKKAPNELHFHCGEREMGDGIGSFSNTCTLVVILCGFSLKASLSLLLSLSLCLTKPDYRSGGESCLDSTALIMS